MFSSKKIKVDKDIYDRAKVVADTAGYATVDEFFEHVMERELQHFEGAESDEDIKNKLKGLGYIA